MNFLITERLRIQKMSMEDAAFVVDLLNSEGWIKYIGDRNVRSLEAGQKYLEERILKSYEDYGFGLYKLILKDTGKEVGVCGFVKRPELDDPDIGFAMLPGHEGQGYGFEAASALLEYAESVLKLNRILAITLPHNLKSVRLLEKLGLTTEKTIYLFDGKEELLLFAKEL